MLDVLGKDLLKQRESTRWFQLGSSCIPVWKLCMLYSCSDVLICGALCTYRRRKRSLNTEMAQQRLAFNTTKTGGGVPTFSGRSGRPLGSTLWVWCDTQTTSWNVSSAAQTGSMTYRVIMTVEIKIYLGDI